MNNLTRDHLADHQRLIETAMRIGAQEAILAVLRALHRMNHKDVAADLIEHHAMVLKSAIERGKEKAR